MFARIFAWALCGALALFPVLASAQSPIRAFPPGTFQNRAAIDAAPMATYQGPGDIVSGASIWGSCARVYNASLASSTTLLCDLVANSAPTVVICTLRAASTGFVDLNLCSDGATVPTTVCGALPGGKCNVSKMYDQIGGTSGWVNVAAASQPKLTFSLANGLPGITCTAAAGCALVTSTTFTRAQPYTFVAAARRTANFTTVQAIFGFNTTPNAILGFAASASTALLTSSLGGNVTLGSVADSSFHAMIGVINSPGGATTSILAVDGTETTGNASTASPSGVGMRLGRYAGGGSIDGDVLEGGFWPLGDVAGGFTSTNRPLMNANIHGTNGYNF